MKLSHKNLQKHLKEAKKTAKLLFGLIKLVIIELLALMKVIEILKGVL